MEQNSLASTRSSNYVPSLQESHTIGRERVAGIHQSDLLPYIKSKRVFERKDSPSCHQNSRHEKGARVTCPTWSTPRSREAKKKGAWMRVLGALPFACRTHLRCRKRAAAVVWTTHRYVCHWCLCRLTAFRPRGWRRATIINSNILCAAMHMVHMPPHA